MRRLDARTGRALAIYRFGGGSLAFGGGRVWATNSTWAQPPQGRVPVLVELDARTDRVVGRFRVGRRDPGFASERHNVAAGGGPIVVERVLSGAGLAAGSLWVHQNAERRLYRIDPRP
jgi:hypothetical protein